MAHKVEIQSDAAPHSRRHRLRTLRLRRRHLTAIRSFLLKVGINTLVLALTLPIIAGSGSA